MESWNVSSSLVKYSSPVNHIWPTTWLTMHPLYLPPVYWDVLFIWWPQAHVESILRMRCCIYSHVLFTFTFCWTSVKRINTNHFSSQPSARPPQVWVWAFQCECENFVPFFLFFRSFKGKCLKHTNSQGQELKPHYGLAPPFSPGVSAWTSVWRSSLRQQYKCAVAALLAIYSVKGVKKTKEYMAGRQTHD